MFSSPLLAAFFLTFSFVHFHFIKTRRWFYRRHFLCNAATLEYNFLKWFSTLHFLCLLLVVCFVGWLVGRLPDFGLLLSSQRREDCKYFSCQLCPASMTMPLSWLAQQEDRRTDQTTDCLLVAVTYFVRLLVNVVVVFVAANRSDTSPSILYG